MSTRLALAALVLALGAAVFATRVSGRMADFEVYWRSGERALHAEPLYRAEDGHYQFKYLPAFAVLSIPLALLPLDAAKPLWFALSGALLVALLALSLRLLPDRRAPAAFLVAATLVTMAKFYGHELVLGQVNLLLGATVLAAIHLHLRGRGAAAGLLIALAVVIKPYAVLFVPWLAAARARAALAAAAAGLAAALLLPVAVYGVTGTVALHVAWWRTVAESTAPNLLNADNISLAGMYAKWLGPGDAAARLAAGTAVVLVLAAAAVVRRRTDVREPSGLEAAILLTLIPLLSPQGWDYVLLLSTPAVMYVLNYRRELPPGLRVAALAALATVAFSLYDVMGRDAYARFMSLSIITVCYLIVTAALVALRMRRVA